MSMSTAEKTRETRLRRMAWRQGLTLKKSRRRDERARDYGEIWLLRELVEDPRVEGNWEVVGSPEDQHSAWVGPFDGYDEVEAYLTGRRDR